MTIEEFMTLARQHLTPADRGQLAAQLIAELGQPKIEGFPPGTAIRGTPKWSEDELNSMITIIGVFGSRLGTMPLEYAQKAREYLREVIGKATGN